MRTNITEKIKILQEKLKDERGKKVVFVSHCLLNENTRYLGGAFRKAGIDEIITELQRQEIGIIQMKCPEQKAWGGVLKKNILKGYGIKNALLTYLRKAYILFFLWNTKRIYQKIANEIVSEIQDYLNSGFEVVGIIGVKGSPSCGVSEALDIKKMADFIANFDTETTDRNNFNSLCYQNCLVHRGGLFINTLKKRLSKERLNIKFIEHNLLAEIKGEKITFKL